MHIDYQTANKSWSIRFPRLQVSRSGCEGDEQCFSLHYPKAKLNRLQEKKVTKGEKGEYFHFRQVFNPSSSDDTHLRRLGRGKVQAPTRFWLYPPNMWCPERETSSRLGSTRNLPLSYRIGEDSKSIFSNFRYSRLWSPLSCSGLELAHAEVIQ